MTIAFDIPSELEAQLRAELAKPLTQVAREALIGDLYRQAAISIGQVAELLGQSRFEAEAWLGARGITMNYTLQDLEDDRRTMDRLFGKVP